MVTFLLSSILVRLFRQYAVGSGFLDVPNHRSSHQHVTPRGGGIVFVLIWLAAITLIFALKIISADQWRLIAPSSALVSLIGFWDDRYKLSANIRLYGQFLAALYCLSLLGGLSSLHLWSQTPTYFSINCLTTGFNFGALFTLIWFMFGTLLGIIGIMWSINVFNFMDGTDGIAATEAIFVFGIGGLLFFLNGNVNEAFIPWTMVLAVAGFLIWNWPKASIFMGDAGSYCLGFLVAILALMGDIYFKIPVMLWIILYSLFWFDATVTLLRRIYYKKHWATAHCDHAYQRLHQAGFSHAQVLYAVIFLNSILAAITLWTYYHQSWMCISLLAAIALLSITYFGVEKLKPMERV